MTPALTAIRMAGTLALVLMMTPSALVVASAAPPGADTVPAARLKRTAVRTEPSASTAGPGRPPMEVRGPDNRSVARVQQVSRGRESRSSRLVVTRSGRRAVIAARVVNYFGMAWSPDGSKIAYSEGTTIHIVDADGKTRQTIYTGPGGPYPGAAFDLRWADGGSTLSFTQVENAEQLDLSHPVRIILTLAAR